MNNRLVNALQACLSGMETGQSLEMVLARYPDLARDLRPLLETAQIARTVAQTTKLPRVAHVERIVVAQRKAEKPVRSMPQRGWQVSFAFVIALVFLLIGTNQVLTAAQSALPGQALYSVKRTAEAVQLSLTFNPVHRQELQEEYQQNRIDEVFSLLDLGSVQAIDLTGTVTAQIPGGWLVEGIPVVITEHTQTVAPITVGMQVHLVGTTQADGSITASSLASDAESDAAIQFLMTATSEPTWTPTPTSTMTTVSSSTSTPVPTVTNAFTATPRPENTNKPATHTPKPENTNKPATHSPKPDK